MTYLKNCVRYNILNNFLTFQLTTHAKVIHAIIKPRVIMATHTHVAVHRGMVDLTVKKVRIVKSRILNSIYHIRLKCHK